MAEMIEGLRADMLDALQVHGIALLDDWHQWTQTQQDRWAMAQIQVL